MHKTDTDFSLYQMASALNVGVSNLRNIPDTPQVKILLSQNRCIPLIKTAIHMLSEQYQSLRLNQGAHKKEKQKQVDKLQKRVFQLSKFFFEHIKDESLLSHTCTNNFSNAESQSTDTLRLAKKMHKKIIDFLENRRSIKSFKNFPSYLKEKEGVIKEFDTHQPSTKQELDEDQSRIKISRIAIKGMASLIKRITISREQCEMQVVKATGVVLVTTQPDREGLVEDLVYIKGFGNSSAWIEKLIYDLGVLLDFPHLFAPTLEYTEENVKSFVDVSQPHRKYYGKIVQKALDGKLLSDFIISGDESKEGHSLDTLSINNNSFLDASIAAMVLGFYDAHRSNTLINPNKKTPATIKFFDNTRAMPCSNGLLKMDRFILSPFWSSLLNFKKSFTPLTSEELEYLLERVEQCQSKLPLIEKFLKSPSIKKRLEALPPGWFPQVRCLHAMEKRLSKIKRLLESKEIQQLADLPWKTYRNYRLALVFHISANRIKLTSPEEVFRNLAGPQNVKKNMKKTARLNLNVEKLAALAYTETSLSKFIQRLHKNNFTLKERDNLQELHWTIEPKELTKVDIQTISRNFFLDQYTINFIAKAVSMGFTIVNRSSRYCLQFKTSDDVLRQFGIDYDSEPGRLICTEMNQAKGYRATFTDLDSLLNDLILLKADLEPFIKDKNSTTYPRLVTKEIKDPFSHLMQSASQAEITIYLDSRKRLFFLFKDKQKKHQIHYIEYLPRKQKFIAWNTAPEVKPRTKNHRTTFPDLYSLLNDLILLKANLEPFFENKNSEAYPRQVTKEIKDPFSNLMKSAFKAEITICFDREKRLFFLFRDKQKELQIHYVEYLPNKQRFTAWNTTNDKKTKPKRNLMAILKSLKRRKKGSLRDKFKTKI